MHPSFVFLANVHGPTQLLAQSQAYTNTTIRLLELNPIAFSPRALPTINTEIRAGQEAARIAEQEDCCALVRFGPSQSAHHVPGFSKVSTFRMHHEQFRHHFHSGVSNERDLARMLCCVHFIAKLRPSYEASAMDALCAAILSFWKIC
jgi:hypothetical protein